MFNLYTVPSYGILSEGFSTYGKIFELSFEFSCEEMGNWMEKEHQLSFWEGDLV